PGACPGSASAAAWPRACCWNGPTPAATGSPSPGAGATASASPSRPTPPPRGGMATATACGRSAPGACCRPACGCWRWPPTAAGCCSTRRGATTPGSSPARSGWATTPTWSWSDASACTASTPTSCAGSRSCPTRRGGWASSRPRCPRPAASRGSALVVRQRQRQQRARLLPQRGGLHDLRVAAVVQHVHQQLARRAVGHLQLVAAVGQVAALLARVPVLVGHPARRLGAEQDRGDALGLAGEDAVAAAEVPVQLGLVDVDGGLLQAARARDAVDREAAQALALVVPGIQVPVVAVVGDALRRYRALRGLVGGAGAVFEGEPAPPEHGRADGAEHVLVQAARAVRDHAHALHRPG